MKVKGLLEFYYDSKNKVSMCEEKTTDVSIDDLFMFEGRLGSFDFRFKNHAKNEHFKLKMCVKEKNRKMIKEGAAIYSNKRGLMNFISEQKKLSSDKKYAELLVKCEDFFEKRKTMKNRGFHETGKELGMINEVNLIQRKDVVLHDNSSEGKIFVKSCCDAVYVIAIEGERDIKGARVKSLKYLLKTMSDRRYYARHDSRPAYFAFDGSDFYQNDAIRSFPDNFIEKLDKEGFLFHTDSITDYIPKPHLEARYIVKVPSKSYIIKNIERIAKNVRPPIKQKHFIINEPFHVDVAKDATLIDDPEEATAIYSKFVAGKYYLPDGSMSIARVTGHDEPYYAYLVLPKRGSNGF
ncbi:MAG: hypothetical protein AB7T10_03330 [bacterium]